VLSLKAGGSGLNLTAASHVVHFDRWWNPAVENPGHRPRLSASARTATYWSTSLSAAAPSKRRIDALIRAKSKLVADVVEGGGEINVTELSDRELLDLVKLDIHSVEEP
jgi:hypothetical protein